MSTFDHKHSRTHDFVFEEYIIQTFILKYTCSQLCRGGQFCWWMKPEYSEKSTDLPYI